MAAVPSPVVVLAPPGRGRDFDAYLDAFEAVAAEGRWMGAEAPLDRDARRAGFDRAVAGDSSVLFLADAGGTIVGSIYASLSGGVVDLGMFVVSGHRGGGIGAALLEAVIDWAREQQAHKVSLAVWPTNYPAIGLYARYGFRVEGTRRRHYRRRSGEVWDATWMGLILDHDTAGGPGPSKPEPRPIVVPDGGIRGPDGSGIVLRGWHRSDIPALVTLIDDPEIRRTLPHIPNPYTIGRRRGVSSPAPGSNSPPARRSRSPSRSTVPSPVRSTSGCSTASTGRPPRSATGWRLRCGAAASRRRPPGCCPTTGSRPSACAGSSSTPRSTIPSRAAWPRRPASSSKGSGGAGGSSPASPPTSPTTPGSPTRLNAAGRGRRPSPPG